MSSWIIGILLVLLCGVSVQLYRANNKLKQYRERNIELNERMSRFWMISHFTDVFSFIQPFQTYVVNGKMTYFECVDKCKALYEKEKESIINEHLRKTPLIKIQKQQHEIKRN